MPQFVNSIHYAFTSLADYKEVQSIPVFYGQIYNFYWYHQRALYDEKDYTDRLVQEIKSFFNDFWIEDKIRPENLVFAFSQPNPLKGETVITTQSAAEWLSEMSGIKYTPQDFRVEKNND